METQKKHYDIKTVTAKAQQYCSLQERSHNEMRNKLHEWGVNYKQTEEIIAELINDNFINEERFAIALAGGKFRIKDWGKLKIIKALKQHHISDYCINKAINNIDDDDYHHTLKETLLKKRKTFTGKLSLQTKNKLLQFALSRGFESELVYQIIKELFDKDE